MIEYKGNKYAIVIFSYNRWDRNISLSWLDREDIYLYIPESEKKHYEGIKANIITHPDSEKGLTRKYEMSFEKFKELGADAIIEIDDDIEVVRDNGIYLSCGKKEVENLTRDELFEVLITLGDIAFQSDAKIFGFGNLSNHLHYIPFRRFIFNNTFDASIFGYIFEDKIKIDKNLPIKADYDMQIQSINKYGHLICDTKYRQLQFNMKKNKGGLSGIRSENTEKLTQEYLKIKWGKSIIFTKSGGLKLKL